MSTRYISTADTAKLIRKALRRSFPGQKFYVRSRTYSMGASIDVSWMDGPAEAEVKVITSDFSGSGFDGMIDLKYYISHWLCPDGTIQVARTPGSSGSGGCHDPVDTPKPHPDAELVSFGSDHVFTHRAISPTQVREFAANFASEMGWEPPQIQEQDWYVGRGVKGRQATFVMDFSRESEVIRFDRELRATSFFMAPAASGSSPPTPTTFRGNECPRCEVTYDRDWTWIKFGAKPAEAVRTKLKALGGRFSRRRTAWYIRQRVELGAINAAISGNGASLGVGPTGEDCLLDAHL